MFEGSPESQLSIINLLTPVILKVKSKIGSSPPTEQERRSRRVGEDWRSLRREAAAAVTPQVRVTKVRRVEGALDIRCLPTVLNCHVC